MATVAYYRSGTLALAALADAHETAVFSVIASIAFGMLMLPNAITTALLPRLSATDDVHSRIACARRALAWTLVVAVLLASAAAVVVPVGLPLVLGSAYANTGVPFAVLCMGIPLIAVSGAIGTALLSVGRLRALGFRSRSLLVVNIVALALLVPSLGAVGASLATVACEAVGLVLLLQAARRDLPGLTALRPLALGRRFEAPGATAP